MRNTLFLLVFYELELQDFTRRFMAAYNAQDYAALGKMYTDDAVRIDRYGKQIQGCHLHRLDT